VAAAKQQTTTNNNKQTRILHFSPFLLHTSPNNIPQQLQHTPTTINVPNILRNIFHLSCKISGEKRKEEKERGNIYRTRENPPTKQNEIFGF
jgi:hypothetical protein